jgi:predicted nucleic acid-binding Zn ribbon protein
MSKERRSSGELKPINEIISDVFQSGKFGNSATVARLWAQWKDIAGEDVALHCFPERVKDKKLYIKVDSPIWRQQLDLMKEELQKRIENTCQNVDIERIIFK